MKIVFLGDSLTQGTIGINYVDRVAQQLRGHHFINAGVNGDTTLNLFRRVEQDVIAHKPDGVLILVGINDAMSYTDAGSRLYFRFVKRVAGGQMSPIAYRENMRALLTRLLAEQIRVWVVLPPVESRPETVATLRQMNAATTELCQDFALPVLDLMQRLTPAHVPERPPVSLSDLLRNLRRSFASPANYDRWQSAGGYTYTFDGIHLTEHGAQVFADEIARFLRQHGV